MKEFPTIERAGDYINCFHCGKRLLTDVEPLKRKTLAYPHGKFRIQCHDSYHAQGCRFWTYYDITPIKNGV